MRFVNGTLVLAATDLSTFLACRHRTALDLEVAEGRRTRRHFDDPMRDLLAKRGLEHEQAYVQSLVDRGYGVVDLSSIGDPDRLVAATLGAMRDGADVIVQGALRDGDWYGKPDILQRVARASVLGDWSYEVADTKLARETRGGTMLQLGLYSDMLATAQDATPEHFHVITPDPEHSHHEFRVADYAAYFRLVRRHLTETIARGADAIAAAYYPEPVDFCAVCSWATLCDERRRRDDHLSLVANISRTQRRELEARDVATLAALARLPLPIEFRPERGSVASYARVREQARLQLESRDRNPPLHELREVIDDEGLCRLPEPSPGDVFLDLEGDHLGVEGGREYLFGVVTLDDAGAPVYRSFWGLDAHAERASFEQVMDLIGDAIARHPDMHVYHYAPYEVTAFKRLMGRYATRENELDAMLRAGRFVDLYAVVRQGLRAGIERYSIKNLEPLYAFAREVPLADAGRGLRAFEYALAIDAVDALPNEVSTTVEGYNKDDCVSTLRLRDWLEGVRAAAIEGGAAIARPTIAKPEPAEELRDRQRATEDLRARLLAGIDDVPARETPEHGRWLLAYLLDYHRREGKAGWWKYYEMLRATDDELLDEPEAVAGLTFVDRVEVVMGGKKKNRPTGSVVDRYRYPPQEMEIRRGKTLKTRDASTFGKVVAVDRAARTIDVKKGKAQAELHPKAVFEHDHIRTEILEDAIAAVGERVSLLAACDGANPIARALLLREPPRLRSGAFHQPASDRISDFAIAIVNDLDRAVLAIQGPPGSGKTYTGARMIRALVAAGKKVGVCGPSHKVITKLLCEVLEPEGTDAVHARIAQKAPDDDDDPLPAGITVLPSNADALRALADNEVDVVGGTAWLWARPEMAGSVDVLFIDEAGQVPLANAIAVSAAATSMVLLGDPQQLDQPRQGSHPDGVAASTLEHLLGEHLTIPPDRGIFLPLTWRLSPAICAFTSELFYESRLMPKASLERQALRGSVLTSGSGLRYLDVEHDGRTSSSDEEVEAVASLVEQLVAPGSSWVDQHDAVRPLSLDDILIVSPFNAQVSRLAERLPGARVGTVDKFQGQEAPVVIYSMTTSRPEDAPRGVEFLYNPNRLNVATSRARCAAVIVANPRLFAPDCDTPHRMKLANALCRYRELATPLTMLTSIIRDH
jgi:uncharacterized protein